MKLISIVVVLLMSFSANALEDMSLQGHLGFERSTAIIGADVDFQIRRAHSIGATFLFSTENTDIGKLGFWVLGGDVKVFFGPDDWKLYLAPGVGLASFDLANGESEMTFGTIMKVGALIEVSYDIYAGLETMMYTNWFSDLAQGSVQTTTASVRFKF